MRLCRLDLLRYGPFTDRILRFDPAARVHVVYGPNEAGKSCALAAVTDLLFGFEHKTAFDFLHPQDSLRVGAEIRSRDGRALDFRRRKGRKNTILDTNDEALPETALTPFLGPVTRDVFCHAFGLSTEALRAGGGALEAAGGDIGAQIFAAGSGLRHLVEIRRTLEGDAEQIFAPQARTRELNKILQRVEQARQDKAKADLLPARWRHLNDAVDQADRAYKEARAARDRTIGEADRLDLLVRTAPILAEIDKLTAERTSLGSFPDAEPGLASRLTDLMATAATRRAEVDRAAGAVETAERDLAAVVIDADLLDAAGPVEFLVSDIGVYAKANQDLPKVSAELAEAKRRLADLAGRLGFASVEALEAARPTDALLARCRELVQEGHTLREALRGATERLDQDRRAFAERQAEADRIGAAIDPAPLLARRSTLAPLVEALSERDALNRGLAEEMARIAAVAARMSPSVPPVDHLAALAVPSVETQRRILAEMTALQAEIGRTEAHHTAATQELDRIDEDLAATLGGPPVVTWADVSNARERREAAWAVFLSGAEVSSDRIGGSAPQDARRRYEAAVAEADGLVDAYARDATRAAEIAARRRRRQDFEAKRDNAGRRLTELSDQRAGAEASWSSLWSPAKIVPLPPGEMIAWTERVLDLMRRIEDQIPRRRRIAELDRIVEGAEPEFRRLAAEIGVGAAADLEIGLVIARTDVILGERVAAWENRRELAVRLRERREAVDRSRSVVDRYRGELDAWRVRFDEAGRTLGLAADHGDQEVTAVLDAWSGLSDRLMGRHRAEERLRELTEAISAYRRRAVELAEKVAPSLAAHPADRIAETLRRNLVEARDAAARRNELRRQLAAAETECSAARRRSSAADTELEVAAAALGMRPGPDFTAWVDRLATAERLDATIAERRRELVRFIPDDPEESLRAALIDFDPLGARARIDECRAEVEMLDRRIEQVFADRARAMEDCARRQESADADLAQQRRIAAEAEARDAARQWLVLRAASHLIGMAVERQRAERQDPVLARAGGLFRILTGGAFVDLRPVYGEDDEAQLAGLRADGKLVPTSTRGGKQDRATPRSLNDRSPMSEGTLDQLYLALRLAMLEDFAARAEPPPFLADDLFASFDDRRTEQGLEVLAEVGGTIQTILFTHHRHVVEIARRKLGTEVDVLELS